jgi:hypothetical protein
MIEGLYHLLWTFHAAEERARLWRSFAIIHDWRLMQGRRREGISVPDEEIRRNEAGLKEFGNLHRLKKPKSDSQDPYHRNWRGGVTLKDMANAVGRELYDGPYTELSDWGHWGVSGIGDSISRQNGHIIINPDSDRVAGLSLLAAFQCILQTLEVANAHLSLNIKATLQALAEEFVATMNSFYGC